MHRTVVLGAGALVATTLMAGPAFAESTTTTTAKPATTTHHVHHVRWRDVAGVFTTMSAADARMAVLKGKGVTGFHVLTLHTAHRPNRFEVESTFVTHAAALKEARAVRHDGFSVRVVRFTT